MSQCFAVCEVNAFYIQIDSLWFLRHLPHQRRTLNRFSNISKRTNEYISRKIQERKERIARGEEGSDFISLYLKEVGKSGGKFEDR